MNPKPIRAKIPAGSELAQKYRTELQREIDKNKRIMALLDTEEFAAIDKVITVCGLREDVYVSMGYQDLEVSVTLYNVKSYVDFDEPGVRFKNAIDSLSEDYKFDEFAESISPEHFLVTWTYTWKYDFDTSYGHRENSIKLSINLWLDKGSTNCRRVQTGVKEVPIYRMECAPPADVVEPDALPAPVILLEGKI